MKTHLEVKEINKGILELKNRLKKPAFRDNPISSQAIRSRISEETELLAVNLFIKKCLKRGDKNGTQKI